MHRSQALKLEPGDVVLHRDLLNADGTPQRWRVTGKPREWKRTPRFRVPIMRGLREHHEINEDNIRLFFRDDLRYVTDIIHGSTMLWWTCLICDKPQPPQMKRAIYYWDEIHELWIVQGFSCLHHELPKCIEDNLVTPEESADMIPAWERTRRHGG